MRLIFSSIAFIKTNFYIFILSAILANTSYGQVPQNGYFINNKGDTISGSILLSNEMDAFQLIKGNEKNTHSSADVKSTTGRISDCDLIDLGQNSDGRLKTLVPTSSGLINFNLSDRWNNIFFNLIQE